MNIKRVVSVIILILVLSLSWIAWPVYGFKAYKGDAPHLPFGWLDMPNDTSAVQEVYDEKFKGAGSLALEVFEKHRAQIGAPSFSAAVSVDGELVWAGAVGYADIKSLTPATPKTVYRIGSTSKPLTATALARLVQKGVMDIDLPISTYLDTLANPAWSTITSRQLASHMAGIPDYKENEDLVGLYQSITLQRHFDDVRDAVDVFDGSPLVHEPGSRFHYSSLNTVLLGATMSAAAGKPYRELMQEEVFLPLGMSATVVAPRKARRGSDLATFYYRQDEQYRQWRPVDLSHRLPGGGFASTPSDLVRLGAKWLDEGFISSATRELFWTPQATSDGVVNHQGYALGWRFTEKQMDGVGLVRHANHGGVSRGSQSWLQVSPDYNIVIAFTSNMKTDEFHEFGSVYEDFFRVFADAVAVD